MPAPCSRQLRLLCPGSETGASPDRGAPKRVFGRWFVRVLGVGPEVQAGELPRQGKPPHDCPSAGNSCCASTPSTSRPGPGSQGLSCLRGPGSAHGRRPRQSRLHTVLLLWVAGARVGIRRACLMGDISLPRHPPRSEDGCEVSFSTCPGGRSLPTRWTHGMENPPQEKRPRRIASHPWPLGKAACPSAPWGLERDGRGRSDQPRCPLLPGRRGNDYNTVWRVSFQTFLHALADTFKYVLFSRIGSHCTPSSLVACL